ncbi:hypothetical protein [Litoreibacter arenae]|nr:hypothetical protein [Litoreibacter arenae]
MPDVRAHWTPNAALFNRFKKAWLLKILGEELGLAQEAITLASSTKKEIVAFCDKLFAEPFATLTDAQREAVATWCPPMMQTTGSEHVEPNVAEDSPDEADCRYVRTLGTLPVNSLIWDGGSIHDERRTRHSTQT